MQEWKLLRWRSESRDLSEVPSKKCDLVLERA